MNEEPDAWAHEVGQLLDRMGQRWALAGALAALEYRSAARATGDADLLTTWHPELVEHLEAAGYHVRGAITPPGEDHPSHLKLRRGSSNVDLLISTTDYQEAALDRAGGEHVLTIEDVLIHKVLADRRRDQADVASILSLEPVLDHEYLDTWMEAWGITDLWEAALARHSEARDVRREK